MQVQLAASAQPDIEQIWAFYLAIDEQLATRAVQTLFDGLDILLKHPKVGQVMQNNLRVLPIKFGQSGFMALYTYNPLTEIVIILRLRHQPEHEFNA
jgi:plasmid stabilization system protein ParE